MPSGKWYLVYEEFENLENETANALRLEKVPLTVVNEEEAVKQAEILWLKRLSEGTYSSWAFGKDVLFPRSPRVIYEIVLQP